ncbi:hypothetical protein LOK49_LG03G00692 [Camellia lanceoleosa]|uniref:Uncharacterized protein n=1 Tax=Camellia lanceoleosa TaxID=1840588 RepID=A0ACC0IE12_9ERIC|nr:hypothetical protein LOK49_LG03G00692 [Camellia lanceoleosa]
MVPFLRFFPFQSVSPQVHAKFDTLVGKLSLNLTGFNKEIVPTDMVPTDTNSGKSKPPDISGPQQPPPSVEEVDLAAEEVFMEPEIKSKTCCRCHTSNPNQYNQDSLC